MSKIKHHFYVPPGVDAKKQEEDARRAAEKDGEPTMLHLHAYTEFSDDGWCLGWAADHKTFQPREDVTG